jgi:thiol-disulfide isomerase/thioredoxin
VSLGQASEALPDAVPSFSLQTVQGATFDLASRKGQPLTAVVFFATWNPKSASGLAAAQSVAAEFADKGLSAVAVNAENETLAQGFDKELAKYVADHQITLPVAVDQGLAVYRDWGIKAIPTTYLLNAELKPVAMLAGAPTDFRGMLADEVKKALGLATSDEVAAEAGGGRYHPARPVLLLYGMADQLAERGREQKALEKVEETIAADAKLPDAFALKGAILLAGKDAAKPEVQQASREAFNKAAEIDATLPKALLGQARFALIDGDTAKALAAVKTTLEQTHWGLASKPSPETLTAAKTKLSEAEGKLGANDAESAKALLGEIVDGFLIMKEKTKVKMRQLDQAAGQ